MSANAATTRGRSLRTTIFASLAAATLAAACGGGSSSSGGTSGTSSGTASGTASAPSAAPSSGAAGPSQYLSVDQASKAVSLKLTITGFNFNGDSNGKMTVTVPQGWKVTAQCTNQTNVAHSCAIVSGASATSPAFTGASTPNPTSGVPAGQSQTFSFTPDKPGSYRIACLVPGHEDAGMWDNFNVTAGGTPSITV